MKDSPPGFRLEENWLINLIPSILNWSPYVDGPYNNFPTIKILETIRVYDKFHACF
jgi:hypothetical protein